MSRIENYEECTCECHENSNIHHVMNCCFACPHCKKKIKKFIYRRHEEACANRNIANAFFRVNSRRIIA